jgi:hypothetical protein
MTAVAIAIGGGGALSKFETTPLLAVEETLDALGRAQAIAYRRPECSRAAPLIAPPTRRASSADRGRWRVG